MLSIIRFALALALVFPGLLAAAEAAPQPVTFQDAVAAREAGRSEAARTAFRRLAKAGFANAQFHLGTMLVDGQGDRLDAVEGAVWIGIAAAQGHKPARQQSPDIMQTLTPAQRQEVKEHLPDRQRRYAAARLFQRHAPMVCSDCGDGESTGPARAKGAAEVTFNGKPAIVHQYEPKYPRELVRRGIPGYVRMAAWVGPDGEFSHPHVIFSDPEWIFDTPALTALQKWRVEWLDGAPDPDDRYVSQSITFYLEGRNWGRKARRQYQRLLADWDKNPGAGYRAARMAVKIGFEDLVGGHEGFVARMYQGAREGLARAQIDLHDHLRAGRGVYQDEPAAAFWLQRAAFSGDGLAQFLLSLRQDFDPPFNRALLHSAAEAGSVPAIMTVLRRQLADPDSADPALLGRLTELLPEFWYMVNPDQTLVEQAKALVSRRGEVTREPPKGIDAQTRGDKQ